ncbi:MAG TPA: hypothetical protein PLC08_03190 [Candidatus Bipolaricaulis sp.]|nr:hypothetical protein [Candidatus Bipolaricaulis sp.]HRS13792.1 hypothetical protein [Candidatus Bipolaricaulis sp.]HRU21500.1 hypothetical protein [Candidatus Bipolaricaulis sp.]
MRRDKERLAVLGVIVGLVAGITSLGSAASFREVPPTIGAYTLRGGEWQIGGEMGFRLLAQEYLASSLSVEYGLAPWFQMGISLGQSMAVMTYSASAKFRLHLGEGFDLGLPFGIGFQDQEYGTLFGYLQGGVVASIRMGELTLHGGMAAGFTREGFFYNPWASADLDILPNLKAVGELALRPLSAAVGTWLRLFPFLDVKIALAAPALSLTLGLYLRL